MERSRYILTSFMTKEDTFILYKTYKKFYEYYPAEKPSRKEGNRRDGIGSMVVFQVPSARAYKNKDEDSKSMSSSKITKKKKLRRKHERKE